MAPNELLPPRHESQWRRSAFPVQTHSKNSSITDNYKGLAHQLNVYSMLVVDVDRFIPIGRLIDWNRTTLSSKSILDQVHLQWLRSNQFNDAKKKRNSRVRLCGFNLMERNQFVTPCNSTVPSQWAKNDGTIFMNHQTIDLHLFFNQKYDNAAVERTYSTFNKVEIEWFDSNRLIHWVDLKKYDNTAVKSTCSKLNKLEIEWFSSNRLIHWVDFLKIWQRCRWMNLLKVE